MTGLVEALFWWEAWGPGPPAPPPLNPALGVDRRTHCICEMRQRLWQSIVSNMTVVR